MRSIATICLFALIAICSAANLYHIQVQLGQNRFDTVNGTLKLYIGRNAFQRDLYRLNETKLSPGGIYTSAQRIPQYIHEIKNATFYWTLSSPIPPKYIFSKPSIYIQSVTVIPTYIQNEQFRRSETKRFCPRSGPTKIKHKEEVKLQSC